ncbi:MAG: GNAT family N-acetyltransferase [Afipia sp. 62-7]|nr:GNAT family N-acetyltransferase [Afipia sp.]OJU15698.1 MAG: GNAT family N-acetyltransferase [Afipia sp. 62-7]
MALREARREDIRRMVEMLADDEVARGREDFSGDMAAYEAAFDAIAADANNMLYVWDHQGAVMGCLQLTFIPGMSYGGSWIAKVEGVRVDRSLRGLGIGEQMLDAMIEKSRARGCKQLQLTTDKRRVDAQRFYVRLGFEASHEGMKINLF